MVDDVDLKQRFADAWTQLPTGVPDVATLRKRGARRRTARVGGVAAVSLIAGALIVGPLWSLAPMRGSSSRQALDGSSGRVDPSPAVPLETETPAALPTDAAGNIPAEAIAGMLTCQVTVGHTNVEAPDVDPIAACAASLTDEKARFSGEWVMCASPGAVHVVPSEQFGGCGSWTQLDRLPDGFSTAVTAITDARAEMAERIPERGSACLSPDRAVRVTEAILAEFGLHRWTVVDRSDRNTDSRCAAPSYWHFEEFEVHVLTED